MVANELEKIVVLNNPLQAELLRGLLEGQGIDVMLSKEAAGTIYGINVGTVSEIEVFVAHSQAAKAKEILDEYFRTAEGEHEED